MSVEFCALDFLVAGGKPVFLEVNLAGDWRWLESIASTSLVTDAAARFLIALHDKGTTVRRRRRGDPVTFLAGGLPAP